MKKRIFLIVLDSFGVGALPDAAAYGDQGSNTLKSVAASPKFYAETLKKLGLFSIDGVNVGSKPSFSPLAAYGRMAERSAGKDTTAGHWEIAGLITKTPFPTYPNGFPPEIILTFEEETGRPVLCNKVYSGTEVIRDYGREQVEKKGLIVYTSADSVFQVAAHESVFPPETLYEYCRKAREILTGKHGVGRVIARPFTGEYPDFKRTENRKDFSLAPTGKTILDLLSESGLSCISVGKINDIFAGRGITEKYKTKNNAEGMAAAEKMLKKDFQGLCFINLVDFDMLYGHRNDSDGYAGAIKAFDHWLCQFLPEMKKDDLLIITADHGCDPGTVSTDHSREYVPLMVCGDRVIPKNLGTRNTFADIAATIAENFNLGPFKNGKSFLKEILPDNKN